jgi:hypothetical protein
MKRTGEGPIGTSMNGEVSPFRSNGWAWKGARKKAIDEYFEISKRKKPRMTYSAGRHCACGRLIFSQRYSAVRCERCWTADEIIDSLKGDRL